MRKPKHFLDDGDLVHEIAVASREEREKAERYWLWCNHGCPIAYLYGDDGEMQCNATLLHRPLDFKREELSELRIATVYALKAHIEKLTAQKEQLEKTCVELGKGLANLMAGR